MNTLQIIEKQWKSMKINRNQWKSMEFWGFYCLGCWKSIEILPGSLPAGLRSVQSSPAGLQISEISKIHEKCWTPKKYFSSSLNRKKCFGLDAWFRSPWFHSILNFERFSNHHHRMHFLSSAIPASHLIDLSKGNLQTSIKMNKIKYIQWEPMNSV